MTEAQLIHQHTQQLIRRYFYHRRFQEINVPNLLTSLPIEPGLYAFKVSSCRKNETFYLSTSPESSLKKLIAHGAGDCFSLSHAFRALEDFGPCHQPEFLMLEWYKMQKDYYHSAQTTQNLFLNLLHGIQHKLNKRKTNVLKYQSLQIDLSPPWHRFTLQQLFKQYAQIDLSQNISSTSDTDPNWEPWFTQIMIDKIEPNLPLDKPVFVFDFPTRLSPLAQPCSSMPNFSQRWELYLAGMELGNAYTELTDAKIMEANFKKETLFRQKNKLPLHPYDQDLIKATSNFPACTGVAIGIDRLSMLLSNSPHINDISLFPHK